MQFLFNEVFLPAKGLFKNSLSSIYGIGSQRGLSLINSVGVNMNLKTKKVSRYKFSILSSLIRKFMLVDASLRRLGILD
jgi:ribosomal protein S13